MRLALSSLAAFALMGCATSEVDEETLIVATLDNIEEESIILSLDNSTSREICVDPQSWPNEAGEVHYASDWIFIETNGRKFSIHDSNLGYCPTGCEYIRVKSGDILQAKIPYKNFSLPNSLYYAEKKIFYKLRNYGPC